MKTPKILAWVVINTLLCVSPLFATDMYVAQTALGANNGTDAADAHSLAWLNTGANWGGATNQVGPGVTVHLCGILTNSLTVQGAGTPGNPITFLFEPNARFSAPTWPGTIISISGENYITIDGGSNGVIEATGIGGGLAYTNSVTGIGVTSSGNCVVRNLIIQNLYMHTSTNDEFQYGCGITLVGALGNEIVTNCVFHDMYQGVFVIYEGSCSNVAMTHCTAYNCNWGGAAGDNGTGAFLNGLTVDHCHFYDWSNWDEVLDNDHHNGFFGWAMSGGTLSNVTYAANHVGPGYGQHNSSGLFVQGNVYNTLAYNNIFDASDGTSPADGLLYLDINKNTVPSTTQVFNNTFAAGGNGNGINYTGDYTYGKTNYFVCMNNEFSSNNYPIAVFNDTNLFMVSDTNNFYKSTQTRYLSVSATSSAGPNTLAQWQSYGLDTHSTTGNPQLNTNDCPATTSLLVKAGANLTALGITNDDLGNARPAAGNWTIGADQVGQPLVPQDLRLVAPGQ
jgi:hypothetical protein